MRLKWILFLVLFTAGCSGLHTGASPDFDWSRVEKVSVQGPWEEYQELQKPTLQEVAAMGYDVVPHSSLKTDARLELEVAEALDINEVGAVFSRPKSLHVRIYDADSGTQVALADYYLSSTQSAVDGVKELFAGVKKERSSSKGENKSTAAAPEEAPPVSVPTVQAEAPGKSPAPASTPASQEQEAETSEWDPAEKKKLSPWVPRLESWGFENWGKSREGDGLEEMMK
ncbi:MAG TPA: hypothetical protein ENN94_04500 [Geoalkalibacter subterraneus]|uniref:Lipoprotein n=1 Tax=Geoalkalibacter subterraneus TaxID=483547 RepID=A0A831PNN2_9BACT|nr:hypothetical protein [Geoalkalibacter subterraneus]